MARYYEGVNGSMQGTAGGVNVYNWRGIWLQRSRRKEVLNFQPTANQAIVIKNFADLSKFLKPLRQAFKVAIPAPAAGQTYYSAAAKMNYTIQRNRHLDPSSKLINFDYADLQISLGELGGFSITLTPGRDDKLTVSWEEPDAMSPLVGGRVVVAVVNDLGSAVTFPLDIDAGNATISYTSLHIDDNTKYHVYACATTTTGATTTNYLYIGE